MRINRMLDRVRAHVVNMFIASAFAWTTTASSGCIVFEEFYSGPYPCENASHCPGGGACIAGACSDLDGDPCDIDQDCPPEQYCNTNDKICGEGNVFDGDFVVDDPLDLDSLLTFHKIDGSLLIGPEFANDFTPINRNVTVVELPLLVDVDGIRIENQAGLTDIDLPSLRRVGNRGLQIRNNNALESIFLQDLDDVRLIEISEHANLLEVRLDGLCEIPGLGGSFEIDTAPKLALVNLPLLEDVGFFDISDFGSEATSPVVVNLPNLENVDLFFGITGNHGMDSLEVPRLTEIGGNFLLIDSNDLDEVSFPSLTIVEGAFNMSVHEALQTFSFPSLTTVGGDLSLTNNDVLTQCELQTFADSLAVGGEVEIESNAVCE